MTFWENNLNQKIDIESSSLSPSSGKSYSTVSSNASARVERNIVTSGTSDGEEENVKTIVYTSDEVKEGYRIVLPSGTKMEVQEVEKSRRLHADDFLYKAVG